MPQVPQVDLAPSRGGVCEHHEDLRDLVRDVRSAQDRDRESLGHDLELIGQSVDDLVEESRAARAQAAAAEDAAAAARAKATAAEARAEEVHGMASRFRRDLWIAGLVLTSALGAGWRALAWELEPPAQAVAVAAHVMARHAAARSTPATTRP